MHRSASVIATATVTFLFAIRISQMVFRAFIRDLYREMYLFRFTITDNGNDLILKIQEIGGEEFSKRVTATTATSFTKNHVVFCSRESTNFADNAVILDDVAIANQGEKK